MALPFLPGGVHVKVIGRWDSQETINNLYFALVSGAPTLLQVQELAALVDGWYGQTMLPLLSENFRYVQTQAQAINAANGFLAITGLNTGIGGVSSEAVPNNVDPCISFRTGLAGRSFRGRNYVPGTPNSMVAGNTLDSDWMADVAAAYNQLTQAGASDPDPFNWVVASFYLAGSPRATAVSTPVVTALFTDNTVDSQRRRLPGRGR